MRAYQKKILSAFMLLNWYTLADFNRNLEKNAAAAQKIDGKEVKIAGFMTNYELIGSQQMTNEFLFVPSALFCVHILPPPPEMTLQVKMKKNVPVFEGQLIWLQGQVKIVPESAQSKKKIIEIEGESVREVKDSEHDEAQKIMPLVDLPDCEGRDKNEAICGGRRK